LSSAHVPSSANRGAALDCIHVRHDGLFRNFRLPNE